MKKYILALGAALLLITGTAFAMDLSQGFLGYAWGTDITGNDDFAPLHSEGIIDYYANEKAIYNISESDAADVVFGAIQGKLYAIFVNIQTEKGYERTKDYLLYKFGNPKVKTQGNVLVYSWFVDGFRIQIKLKQDKDSGNMKLAIYYKELIAPSSPAFSKAMDAFPSFQWKETPTNPEAIPLLSF